MGRDPFHWIRWNALDEVKTLSEMIRLDWSQIMLIGHSQNSMYLHWPCFPQEYELSLKFCYL